MSKTALYSCHALCGSRYAVLEAPRAPAHVPLLLAVLGGLLAGCAEPTHLGYYHRTTVGFSAAATSDLASGHMQLGLSRKFITIVPRTDITEKNAPTTAQSPKPEKPGDGANGEPAKPTHPVDPKENPNNYEAMSALSCTTIVVNGIFIEQLSENLATGEAAKKYAERVAENREQSSYFGKELSNKYQEVQKLDRDYRSKLSTLKSQEAVLASLREAEKKATDEHLKTITQDKTEGDAEKKKVRDAAVMKVTNHINSESYKRAVQEFDDARSALQQAQAQLLELRKLNIRENLANVGFSCFR
jgi:hypothetical protein